MTDETEVICFAQDTMIATISGERSVQGLREGDKIITRDNGLQEICWIGHKTVTLADKPKLRPIRIKAGSLGHNQPERDIYVSPNHRMLIANDTTSLLFDERETLVAAKHLVGRDGVDIAEATSVSYYHILFENHEVVLGNGAWSESFQPGDYSMDTLEDAQRREIYGLFPELKDSAALGGYAAARRSLNKKEAALLRHH
ncbi:Hint domain-containing protein [Cognatishimia sp. SS12]|uniref:Hint domain-containing protein n=1 Tax=Cognatishimia sp. SS12 TaxID=2979465 RepID=UPI002331585C|nr:Hint domain-containing protein [Cognatishimia sp. SS12]MDC0738560.1 Hint domain-containing protein [Cognatishimia sp. SS12]